MNTEEKNLFDALEKKLQQQGKGIEHRSAFEALLKLIPGIGEGIYHSITAADAKADALRARIELDLMAELLMRIDGAISAVKALALQQGANWTEVGGVINLIVSDADSAVGAHITPSGGTVKFSQGTEINMDARNVRSVTGLLIGDSPERDNK